MHSETLKVDDTLSTCSLKDVNCILETKEASRKNGKHKLETLFKESVECGPNQIEEMPKSVLEYYQGQKVAKL